MGLIRGENTRPEMLVRKLTHGMGFRYKLHDKSLPGKPDLVFPKRRKVIFVHGCFWHMHSNCVNAKLPKSRPEFWTQKLERNRQRDFENIQKLTELGWSILVIWECEMRDINLLQRRITEFLK